MESTITRLPIRVCSLLAVLVCQALALPVASAKQQEGLQIYFIDVEGGQATLVVTPQHHSLLIDAGFPGKGGFDARPGDQRQARDANRIVAAARAAGIRQIDYLLATHFHGDHIGGVPELSQLLPIGTFVDHGGPNPDAEKNVPGTMDMFLAYQQARSTGRHLEPKPGEHLPLTEMDVLVVSAAGMALSGPLPGAGAANALCGEPMPAQDPYENPRSTGLLVTFGQFRFLDVGDLTGEPLFGLACPHSLIGPVDVYLVAHHGGPDAGGPAVLAAFAPRVAVMNNGLKKGGARNTYESLHHVQNLDTWQMHRSEAAADQNFQDQYIANLDESTAYNLKLTAHKDGSFTILNGRTGVSRTYGPSPR